MYVIASDNRRIFWSVVVSTVSPVTLNQKTSLKINKKHGNLARISEFSRELLLAGFTR